MDSTKLLPMAKRDPEDEPTTDRVVYIGRAQPQDYGMSSDVEGGGSFGLGGWNKDGPRRFVYFPDFTGITVAHRIEM